MRKIMFFLMLSASLSTVSCSDDDSNTEQQQYEVTLTGVLKTDYCDISTNSYEVKVEYLSGSEINDTDTWTGGVQNNAIGNSTLSGNIIGIRVKLTNFNPDNLNSGRGTGFDNIHIKITDAESDEVLLDQNRNEYLVICTDVIYEILYLYDTSTRQLTSTQQYHNF